MPEKAGLSILRVVSNEVLDGEEEKRQREQALSERQAQPLLTGLTSYMKSAFDAARDAKRPVEDRMLDGLRQRNGEYDDYKLSDIHDFGGSDIFMMLTETKCRAAESWLRDILLEEDAGPPWDLTPTPIPALPPESEDEINSRVAERVMAMIQSEGEAPTQQVVKELREVVLDEVEKEILKEASNRIDGMRFKIKDQFAQGGWVESFNDFITDLSTFPTAFIKGPVVRRQRTLEWGADETGKTKANIGERLAPEFDRVDPFRIFPEPGICKIDDGYIFEHHRMSRSDLSELIGVPAYDEDAIRKVLADGAGVTWFVDEGVEREKEEIEGNHVPYEKPNDMYDALEFWGKVSGQMLREWGLTEQEVPDEAKEYDANVWVVGNYIIKAVLNYDPLGKKPYRKTSFIKTPGSFWGRSIPEMIADIQSVCNAAARALVNNMGIASGPQVEVNLDRIPSNEDITDMHPWKIWQTVNDPMGSSAKAVNFFQPGSNVNELMGIYDKFSQLADDHSGIPAYIHGNVDVSGAGRTSSGLSMLMGAAGKGIRQVVSHIDNDIVKPIVQAQFVYNMRYDEDESIKGDAEIVARGATYLAVRETTDTRRLEFLNATANEMDMQILGPDGRAEILRQVAKGLKMPLGNIMPSREKEGIMVRGQQKAAAENPTPTDPAGDPKGGKEGNVVSNQDTGKA
jgi:hypothetical protein